MQFEVLYRPAHSLAVAHLGPGESVRAEAGAMVSMTNNVHVDTQGPAKAAGGGLRGMLKGIGKMVLGGESFFTNLFTAQGSAGHVTLAPSLCGDMIVHELQQGQDLLIQGSSYVAAPDSVQLDTKFQGMKGFFSGESLFFLKASGYGPVLVNAFGAVETIDLNGEMIVDTGHLVAFTAGINYTPTKVSKGWISAFMSGEGIVLKMSGQGKLYVQTRNPNEYGAVLGAMLPPKEG